MTVTSEFSEIVVPTIVVRSVEAGYALCGSHHLSLALTFPGEREIEDAIESLTAALAYHLRRKAEQR